MFIYTDDKEFALQEAAAYIKKYVERLRPELEDCAKITCTKGLRGVPDVDIATRTDDLMKALTLTNDYAVKGRKLEIIGRAWQGKWVYDKIVSAYNLSADYIYDKPRGQSDQWYTVEYTYPIGCLELICQNP